MIRHVCIASHVELLLIYLPKQVIIVTATGCAGPSRCVPLNTDLGRKMGIEVAFFGITNIINKLNTIEQYLTRKIVGSRLTRKAIG